jgi:hypothetical protein
VIELLFGVGAAELDEGRDHSLRWSPEVASRSVRDFEDGGSHNTRVIGYVCVASASFVNSSVGAPGCWGSAGPGRVSRT